MTTGIAEGLIEAIVSQMEANTAAMRRSINDARDRLDATFAVIDARHASASMDGTAICSATRNA